MSEQLRSIGIDSFTVLLEPVAKNTAPALAYAANYILTKEDANLLVLPSDHFIGNDESFLNAVKKAATYSEKKFLVTFGVEPVRAETGYGYMLKGKSKEEAVCSVEEFIEKPHKEIAQKYYEIHHAIYFSVPLLQGFYIFEEIDLLKKNFETLKKIVEKTINSRDDYGFFYWAEKNGEFQDNSLISATSSIYLSLKAAIEIYKFLNEDTKNLIFFFLIF